MTPQKVHLKNTEVLPVYRNIGKHVIYYTKIDENLFGCNTLSVGDNKELLCETHKTGSSHFTIMDITVDNTLYKNVKFELVPNRKSEVVIDIDLLKNTQGITVESKKISGLLVEKVVNTRKPIIESVIDKSKQYTFDEYSNILLKEINRVVNEQKQLVDDICISVESKLRQENKEFLSELYNKSVQVNEKHINQLSKTITGDINSRISSIISTIKEQKEKLNNQYKETEENLLENTNNHIEEVKNNVLLTLHNENKQYISQLDQRLNEHLSKVNSSIDKKVHKFNKVIELVKEDNDKLYVTNEQVNNLLEKYVDNKHKDQLVEINKVYENYKVELVEELLKVANSKMNILEKGIYSSLNSHISAQDQKIRDINSRSLFIEQRVDQHPWSVDIAKSNVTVNNQITKLKKLIDENVTTFDKKFNDFFLINEENTENLIKENDNTNVKNIIHHIERIIEEKFIRSKQLKQDSNLSKLPKEDSDQIAKDLKSYVDNNLKQIRLLIGRVAESGGGGGGGSSDNAKYDSVFNTVCANSAAWGTGGIPIDTTRYESTHNTVSANSGNWQGVYTTVQTNSSSWYTGIPNNQDTSNFRFVDGLILFWDSGAYNEDPSKPWRALGVDNAQTVWTDPMSASNVFQNVNQGINYRIKDGLLQFWDNTAYIADNTKPWRALGVNNGAITWTDPLST